MIENIIKPQSTDALEIAKLIKDGWNSAYIGIISDEELKNMDVAEMSESWKKNIETNKSCIYVYKENNRILGVVRFGKVEDQYFKNTGEVFVLYVRVDEKRKGIGTQLINFVKKELVKLGYNKMIIWCLKGNIQGANFYKKHGGKKIKERNYKVRGIKVREECYYFNLE